MKREVLFHPVEFGESALRKTPEILNAVNVDTAAF